ncbi:MAG: MBL fold metallo-hydrolase [Bacteroidetes bacterium]|nr:MBL fold metallo-hydrolase [Bacteroidota bacterium]
MTTIQTFTFGPFQENTYILSDETKQAILIDAGCFESSEQQALASYIKDNKLNLVKLINTHGHVDHVIGNKFVYDTFGLSTYIHKLDLPVLEALPRVAQMYGFHAEAPPAPAGFIDEGDQIVFGNTVLDILFTPGHSPGSVCFYHKAEQYVIGGDVLFYGSIGRTDLPGGNHAALITSIKTKLLTLDDTVKVYSGHGPVTNIGFERKNNPFLK